MLADHHSDEVLILPRNMTKKQREQLRRNGSSDELFNANTTAPTTTTTTTATTAAVAGSGAAAAPATSSSNSNSADSSLRSGSATARNEQQQNQQQHQNQEQSQPTDVLLEDHEADSVHQPQPPHPPGVATAAAVAAVDVLGGLPELSDVIFTPEKVNAHTLMNKWITEDETRHFAFLRKEKKAVVTFQCRIVVKGAKHLPLQIAAGPSVDFLMPTWLLVRYIQSELLPFCIFEDYRLVENWMRLFVEEVRSLTAKAARALQQNDLGGGSAAAAGGGAAAAAQHAEFLKMTRHVVHAAASVVNSTDLFLGLISAAKDHEFGQSSGGGGGGRFGGGGPGAGGGYDHQHHHHGYDDDDGRDTPPMNAGGGSSNLILTSSSHDGQQQQQSQQQQQPGFFSRLLGRGRSSSSPPAAVDNGSFAFISKDEVADAVAGGGGGGEEDPTSPLAQLEPHQREIFYNTKLTAIVPAHLRQLPEDRSLRGYGGWLASVCYAVATGTRWSDLRSRFILPRPTTKEEWQLAELLREQVKANRTHVGMFVAFVFLCLCRWVSFDLFLILVCAVLYGARYILTEYKAIFMYFTKRTARSRVNRVKDWFTFGVRRKNSVENNAGGGAASSGQPQEDVPADFDLEEWDFF